MWQQPGSLIAATKTDNPLDEEDHPNACTYGCLSNITTDINEYRAHAKESDQPLPDLTARRLNHQRSRKLQGFFAFGLVCHGPRDHSLQMEFQRCRARLVSPMRNRITFWDSGAFRRSCSRSERLPSLVRILRSDWQTQGDCSRRQQPTVQCDFSSQRWTDYRCHAPADLLNANPLGCGTPSGDGTIGYCRESGRRLAGSRWN